MAHVLGICGSPRRGGNSETLLRAVLAAAAEAGPSIEVVFLREIMFSSCIGCERCRKDKVCTGLTDGMTVLYPKIEAATGLVTISPCHHYNVTALMKACIDRLYCYYDFTDQRPRAYSSRLAGQGRLAVVGGVCEQPEPEAMGVTIPMQRQTLQCLGYTVVATLEVHGIFDPGAVKNQQESMDKAWRAGQALGERLSN